MAYAPIAFTAPEYDRNLYKNYWLKAYEQGTTTPKVMATDSSGATTVAKFELNAQGFPVTSGGAIVIPYIDGAYDLWLFPTEAEADANDTTNALLLADNVTGVASSDITQNKTDIANFYYDSIADAKADTGLSTTLPGGEPVYVRTGGYTSFGDGGGALYRVVAGGTGTDDGGSFHDMSNGNQLQYIPSGDIFAEQWGVSPSSSDIGVQVNNALTYVKNNLRGILRIGPGNFTQTTTITIPNNVSFVGAGKGFASNYRTKINYTGSGTMIDYDGFYVELEGMLLNYDGASKSTSVCIDYDTVTRTSLKEITITGFGTGITNNQSSTTFTHLHRDTYIKDCTIGVDLAKVNNVIFDKCFIESNGTGVVLETCFNAVFYGGTVLEVFGDNRLSETQDSKILIADSCRNVIIRDCYTEIGTLATASNNIQLAILRNVQGFTCDSNYVNRSANNQAAFVGIDDDNCTAVSVTNNAFLKGPSSGTDYVLRGNPSLTVLELSSVSGTFQPNETVTGGTSGATAIVDSVTDDDLFVGSVAGTFSVGETITGGTSGATGTLDVIGDLSEVTFPMECTRNSIKSTMLNKEIEYTPILEQSGSPVTGITYGVQEATCTLSGDSCTVNFNISLTAASSPSAGALSVSLPSTIKSFSGLGANNEHFGFMLAKNLTSAFSDYAIRMESGDTCLPLMRDLTTAIQGSNLTATSVFRGQITFPIERQDI